MVCQRGKSEATHLGANNETTDETRDMPHPDHPQQRERADKPDRTRQSERQSRSETRDRSDRQDRPDRFDRPYRIEGTAPAGSSLLPEGSTREFYRDRGLAVAVKSLSDPTRQQVRVVHVPSGEVVFESEAPQRGQR